MTNIILLQLSSIGTIIDHWIKLDHFGSIGCFAFSLNLNISSIHNNRAKSFKCHARINSSISITVIPSLAPTWWITNGQNRQLMQDFQEIVRLLTMSKALSKITPMCIACPWPPLTHDPWWPHHSWTPLLGREKESKLWYYNSTN